MGLWSQTHQGRREESAHRTVADGGQRFPGHRWCLFAGEAARSAQCSLSSLACSDLKFPMVCWSAEFGLRDCSSTRYPQMLSRHTLVKRRLEEERERERDAF